MTGAVIGSTIAQVLAGILDGFARSGVTPEELEAGKQAALTELASMDAARLAQEAKEWRIAQGLET